MLCRRSAINPLPAVRAKRSLWIYLGAAVRTEWLCGGGILREGRERRRLLWMILLNFWIGFYCFWGLFAYYKKHNETSDWGDHRGKKRKRPESPASILGHIANDCAENQPSNNDHSIKGLKFVSTFSAEGPIFTDRCATAGASFPSNQ